MSLVAQLSEYVIAAFGVEWLILFYAFYELRWGRGKQYEEGLARIGVCILALAREEEGVDEEKIAAHLPGDNVNPEALLRDGGPEIGDDGGLEMRDRTE